MEVIMKKIITMGISLVGLVMVFGAASVFAQLSTQYKADIPFDFSARNAAFAAGEYRVGPANSNSGTLAIWLLNKETGEQKMVGMAQAGANTRKGNAKLIFHRQNGQYALRSISTPDYGMELRRTKTEVRIVKAGGTKADVVAVNLTQ